MDFSGQEKKLVTGKTFTSTYQETEDVMIDPIVKVSQTPYYLTEADFQTLISQSTLSRAAILTLMLSFGIAFPVIGKYIQFLLYGLPSEIRIWELITLSLIFIAGVSLLLIDKIFPSKQKKLIQKIEKHFETTPKTIEAHRRKK